jgi:hypothetical protein
MLTSWISLPSRLVRLGAPLLLCAGAALAQAQSVNFVEPKDGATVGTTFTVKLSVTGLKVAPAGDKTPNTGHHHILVNQDAIEAGEEIPFTRRHIHLSKGQTEIEITLQPGSYKLTAQFGDGDHKSLGPKLSRTISITVK